MLSRLGAGRRPLFVAGNAPAHIIREIGFGKLAVIDTVDAAFRLPLYRLRHCRLQALVICSLVVGCAVRLGENHVPEVGRARQRAGMCRKNAIGTIEHGFLLVASAPELAAGQRCALCERFELGPGDLRVNAAAEAAVGRRR